MRIQKTTQFSKMKGDSTRFYRDFGSFIFSFIVGKNSLFPLFKLQKSQFTFNDT
jgi:hypothetical protein